MIPGTGGQIFFKKEKECHSSFPNIIFRHLNKNIEHPRVSNIFESSSTGTSLGLGYKQSEMYSQEKLLNRSDEQ